VIYVVKRTSYTLGHNCPPKIPHYIRSAVTTNIEVARNLWALISPSRQTVNTPERSELQPSSLWC